MIRSEWARLPKQRICEDRVYLKRLHLHGFKSFATRTALDFSPGVTGIVGPNGAGKSNVSDALRWVLGEQSMRQLRGKKSEDIIFAGGRGRTALGMAEVTLTLDNATNWLPSEFSEVTVTRRAFRSGESDYYLNGAKVRLKDVLALLSQARIGHDSYTIIGQGLVDQALSARAEERRSLFEDAAGIRHFQAQRNEAEQRLAQTRENLSRLHDILSEIEPRLGPLGEQARRARDYITTRSELDRMLRYWYGAQWSAAHAAHVRATAAEQTTDARLAELRATIAADEAAQHAAREQRDVLNAAIADLRRQRGDAHARAQTLERDLAVARERAASLERAQADLAGERERTAAAQADAERLIATLEDSLAVSDAALAAERAALGDLEQTLHRARQALERDDARLRGLQRDAAQAQARLSAAQGELTRLNRQRDDRRSKLETRRATAAQSQTLAAAAAARLETLRAAHEALRAEFGARLVRREALTAEIAAAQADAEQRRADLADAQRERRAAADRLTLLREWAGARGDATDALAALASLPESRRPNVLGILGQIAGIAPQHEAALEAALGPFLGAIVAASEDDAWHAVTCLAGHVGRVVIVWPTDQASDGADLAALVEPGTDPAILAAVRGLLGGMALVPADDDPADLRWRVQAAPVVSARGDIAHPAGWLAFGQRAAGDGEEGVLARARELRALPDRVAALDEHIRVGEGLLTNARAALAALREEQTALEKDLKGREAKLSDGAKGLGQAQRESERLAGEAALGAAIEQQMAVELTTLEDEIAAAEEHYGEVRAAQRDQTATLDEAQGQFADEQAAHRASQDDLARRRTALAVAEGEHKAVAQRLTLARDQWRALTDQATQRDARLDALARQRDEIAAAAASLSAELAAVRDAARALSATLATQEAAAAAADQRQNALEAALAGSRAALSQAEGDYRRALLDAQRARDAIESLRAQMAEEMDAADAEALQRAGDDSAEPLPADEHARLRRQIDHLRGRLKSLGGYDPEAPQAYEELKSRYEFLTGQVRDMEEASARLRAVIIELDATMRRRFEETFQAVNVRFQRHFTTLFQGGAARLELTAPRRPAKSEDEDDDEPTAPDGPPVAKRGLTGGVEVFVQIPGKKAQDLALLSGGERAMVSAALLFALLETNPPPFCLLDEVDAALDEANVVRFCEILRQLAGQTQFIVITHNRVTMTHADAIYGVSMTDSVSRILSMRLAEAQTA